MKEATGITQKHHSIISSRLNKLLENFENFGNITLQSIYDFLSTKGASRKTLGEWFNTYNDFFNYCVRLDAIKSNPLAKWTIDDFGRKKIKKTIEFIAVDVAPKFLNYISSQHPEYLKYYVLSMFSGIRVAEVLRMSENLFDYEKKHIFLPAEITKEKKAEHLADFEPNLWAWLEVCKGMDIKAPSSNTRARIFKKFGLTQNFARHSFATYHYSLYQDSKRTAALTHHTEEVLKNNYMGALVSVDEAREYFNITPDALVRWAEKLKKEDYEAIAGNEIAQKDFSKRIKGLRSDK